MARSQLVIDRALKSIANYDAGQVWTNLDNVDRAEPVAQSHLVAGRRNAIKFIRHCREKIGITRSLCAIESDT